MSQCCPILSDYKVEKAKYTGKKNLFVFIFSNLSKLISIIICSFCFPGTQSQKQTTSEVSWSDNFKMAARPKQTPAGANQRVCAVGPAITAKRHDFEFGAVARGWDGKFLRIKRQKIRRRKERKKKKNFMVSRALYV